MRAAVLAVALCACDGVAEDVPAVVDGCVGVLAVDDDAIADAAFDEFNVTFSRCRRDDTSISCRADVVDLDACRRDRLPLARAILDRTAPTARVDCTSLCEVE